jgi:hypothetical protein
MRRLTRIGHRIATVTVKEGAAPDGLEGRRGTRPSGRCTGQSKPTHDEVSFGGEPALAGQR